MSRKPQAIPITNPIQKGQKGLSSGSKTRISLSTATVKNKKNQDETAFLLKIEDKMRDMDKMMERVNSEMTVIQNGTDGLEEQSKLSCSIDNEIKQEEEIKSRCRSMDKNTFSIMIVSKPFSLAWWYGFVILVLQIIIIALIIHEQFVNSNNKPMWNVPLIVPSYVSFGQFVFLIIVMATSDSFMSSVKNICSLQQCSVGANKGDDEEDTTVEYSEEEFNENSMQHSIKNATPRPKSIRILVPSVLQLIESLLFLFASLVVIVQSEDVIQLFINLIVLQVVSYCSKLAYRMSEEEYFGSQIAEAAIKVTQVQLEDIYPYKPTCWKNLPIHTCIITFVFAVMVIFWASVSQTQRNRTYLKQTYDECFQSLGSTEFDKVADGTCDGLSNILLCGYDGGDCADFNERWPGCKVLDTEKIQDGICDGDVGYHSYNTKECGWDGGDCITNCTAEWKDWLGNGICDNFYPYNTAECDFDGDDCTSFNLKYKNCTCPENDSNCAAESILYKLEDGICNNYSPYNSAECKYDGGDCEFFLETYKHCSAERTEWINDTICENFAPYNTADCGYDGGDCLITNSMYPDCKAPYPSYIGDGYCDGPLWNSEECGFDGGDCISFMYPQCEAFDYFELGNGRCWDKEPYNTEKCGYDGGDCKISEDPFPECNIDVLPPYFKWFPSSVGDKICELEFNTEECGWDGGDCVE